MLATICTSAMDGPCLPPGTYQANDWTQRTLFSSAMEQTECLRYLLAKEKGKKPSKYIICLISAFQTARQCVLI